ncbi:MAG: hypothetical protein ACOC6D_02515 [Atribacterota bacterium]
MKKWLFVIIIILVIISGFSFWKIIISPQYSLKQLKKAISENDVTVFEKYVALDNVVDSIITQSWNYYYLAEETETRWDKIRQEIGNSLLSVVKPNLKEIIKKEVLEYIKTGSWADIEKEDENKIYSVVRRLIKKRVDPQQWDQQSINYTEVEGDTAHVGLTYYDQSKKTNFLVEVKMRYMNGYWQLMEITNITQLINIFENLNNN